MNTIVTYDIVGNRRRNRFHKFMKELGLQSQYSVFECNVDPAQWAALRQGLIDIIDKEADSLRFYFLGSNWKRRVEHIGAKGIVDLEGPLIL